MARTPTSSPAGATTICSRSAPSCSSSAPSRTPPSAGGDPPAPPPPPPPAGADPPAALIHASSAGGAPRDRRGPLRQAVGVDLDAEPAAGRHRERAVLQLERLGDEVALPIPARC